MKKSMKLGMVAALLSGMLAGCATMKTAEHQYIMKGQVLEVNDGSAYLCIGSAEGAKPGQDFQVYRYTKAAYGGQKQTGPNFRREAVGTVKIKQIVDEHYAEANVTSGSVSVNDIAELSP